MSNGLFIVVCIAEVWSLILIIKLWRSNEDKAFKMMGTLIGLIPILGTFLMFFIFSPQPQATDLQNRGPRGWYSNSWSVLRDLEKEKARLQDNEEKTKGHEDNA